ncbi:hypothetical protein Tco_1201983, partial [Tanacetum coccineum]
MKNFRPNRYHDEKWPEIPDYVTNPLEDSSPALLQFIAERTFDISMMLIAFVDLYFATYISDTKPFVSFEENTLDDVEDFFQRGVLHGWGIKGTIMIKWDDKANERHGLWETTRRTLDQ